MMTIKIPAVTPILPKPAFDSKNRQPLPPAAMRALKEAEERRALAKKKQAKSPKKELGGPKGKEPSRYGDWEYKGRAIDF